LIFSLLLITFPKRQRIYLSARYIFHLKITKHPIDFSIHQWTTKTAQVQKMFKHTYKSNRISCYVGWSNFLRLIPREASRHPVCETIHMFRNTSGLWSTLTCEPPDEPNWFYTYSHILSHQYDHVCNLLLSNKKSKTNNIASRSLFANKKLHCLITRNVEILFEDSKSPDQP